MLLGSLRVVAAAVMYLVLGGISYNPAHAAFGKSASTPSSHSHSVPSTNASRFSAFVITDDSGSDDADAPVRFVRLPVPPSVLLLGSALVGMMALGRRRPGRKDR